MTSDGQRLADGSTPATPDELFARLDELGIRTRTIRHVAVFTVSESKAHRGELHGGHTKNLFLRNKKGRMWLVVCREDLEVDLKALASKLGAGRFSFASTQRLMKYLGVIPGAVTPFGVINDTSRQVQVVIDRAALEDDPLNFHPLDNSMTTEINAKDLLRFLEAEGHPARVIDLL
jgi:Ala-tRNA(Pro) deacylase